MIAGHFHKGSGLGNQLHRYVATRVLAEDKGYRFGMYDPDLFKGDSFMKIDKGHNPINDGGDFLVYKEKEIRDENGVDIRGYDPEFNFIQDHTVIDGEFQDPRYFEHRLEHIQLWLEIAPLDVPDDVCVIGFRGGEYSLFKDLFLPKEYWDKAIAIMRAKNPQMRFEVHTDDEPLARQFFPDFPVIHDVGINWRSMRYAKHAIIANSSFYILPRLLANRAFGLSENGESVSYSNAITIAPKYWARHNTKVWALPQNYYKQFTYIHAEDRD